MMDSLRYWVLEMHVDGFRFDLAASLASQFHEVDKLSAFFDLIHQDPVISQIKLIAEPWDVGSGGYQVGNFPVLWSEWNGRYRDNVRDYWRQQSTSIGDLAHRLTGSSDLYEATGRRPWASVNFVTAHDGFTLADLVSHPKKDTTRPTGRPTASALTTGPALSGDCGPGDCALPRWPGHRCGLRRRSSNFGCRQCRRGWPGGRCSPGCACRCN